MMTLYWADIENLEEGEITAPLSSYRKERLASMRHPEARKRGLGAEILLQHALSKECPEMAMPPEILLDAAGKPYLKDIPLHFSLSHSGRYAACAVSDRPIGLDIQVRTAWDPALTARFFTEDEQLFLRRSQEPDRDFTALWCRKEAFLKVTGLGLRLPLSSFSVAPGAERAARYGKQYSFWQAELPGFFSALCCEGSCPAKVEITELSVC